MRSAGVPTGSSRSNLPLIVLKSSNDATALTAATSASARCSPHFPSKIAQLRFYRRPNQTKPRILTDEHGLRACSLSLIPVYPWLSSTSVLPQFQSRQGHQLIPGKLPRAKLPPGCRGDHCSVVRRERYRGER